MFFCHSGASLNPVFANSYKFSVRLRRTVSTGVTTFYEIIMLDKYKIQLYNFNMYIPRFLSAMVEEALKQFPAVLITGPRQAGKTTFLLQEFGKKIN